MKLRPIRCAVVLAVALFASVRSEAIVYTPLTGTTYAFSCSGPTLAITPVAFSLAAGTSNPASANGNVTLGPLTILFLANQTYNTLFQDLVKKDTFTSCILTETAYIPATSSVPASTHVTTWTLELAAVTGVTALGNDASTPNYLGSSVPTALVQATFAFSNIKIQAT